MKKVLTFILVLSILCSIPAFAFAETPTSAEAVTEYLWSDAEAAVKNSGVAGRFVKFDEVTLTFWLPDIYEDVLDQEDKDDGFIGVFKTEDDDGYVGVPYDKSDWNTLEAYLAELLEDDDFIAPEIIHVNGLEAVQYMMLDEEAKETTFYVFEDFITNGGNLVSFCIYPLTEDEDIQVLTEAIISSIMTEDDLAKAA